MGSRKISFDPATISAGLDGFTAIEVSLCGPGSLLTSMLVPTETPWVFPGSEAGENPGAATVSNFCHQVGLLCVPVEAEVAALAAAASPAPGASDRPVTVAAVTKVRSRVIRAASLRSLSIIPMLARDA